MGLTTHSCLSGSLCLSKGLLLTVKVSDTHNQNEHLGNPGPLAHDMCLPVQIHLSGCVLLELHTQVDFVGGLYMQWVTGGK